MSCRINCGKKARLKYFQALLDTIRLGRGKPYDLSVFEDELLVYSIYRVASVFTSETWSPFSTESEKEALLYVLAMGVPKTASPATFWTWMSKSYGQEAARLWLHEETFSLRRESETIDTLPWVDGRVALNGKGKSD
jgi:hypothetical protein